MSLATRCPACSTVFRVVQDQLKVSGGWVRCGHCHEVFNGLEALFELPPDPPPAPEPEAPPPAPVVAEAPPARFDLDLSEPAAAVEGVAQATAPAPLQIAATPPAEPLAPADAPVPPLPVPPAEPPSARAAAQAAAPAQPASNEDLSGPVTADPDPEPAATASTPRAAVGASAAAESPPAEAAQQEVVAPAPPTVPEDLRTGPDTATQVAVAGSEAGPTEAWSPRQRRKSRKRQRAPKPAFVRQAEQAALWRRPAMRALLGFTAMALAALLGLQVMHQQRDHWAARWPALQAPLRQWCELARCSLQPPRALAQLALDSSALARTPRAQTLRFEADLRNAADHMVRAPAVELSFTDNQGRLLVRKVLRPEELGAPADGIAAEGTWRIDAQLDTGDLRIASFTAEIFYP